MKTYIIKYYDRSGDLTTIWVRADSKEDAERQAHDEYWDIQKIADIYAEDN